MVDQENQKTGGVVRSQVEIEARIQDLKQQIKGNQVFVHHSWDKTLLPESQKTVDIFNAKLNELKWFLGEKVEVTDGV